MKRCVDSALTLLAVAGLLQVSLAAAQAVNPYGQAQADVRQKAALPSAAELENAGAVIGDIVIDAQNIFDLNDPKEDKALFRTANRIRIKTRDGVIRQQLLFRSGDRYSQRLLEESARILRSARYLYDASVRPIAWHDGRVDVLVTTRDVWTLNPGLSFGRHGGANTYGFELEELNILGTGTSLSLSRKSGIDRDATLVEYKNPHLAGTWASLMARYSNNSDGSLRRLDVDRPFYALDSHWAAGGLASDDDRVDSLYDRGKVVDQFRVHEKSAQAYWGWSRGLENGWTRRWRVGATFDEHDFAVARGWTGATVLPEDRKFAYPWLSFELIEDEFGEFSNRDQIGRTEDFYLGTRLQASIGWADSALGSDRSALMFKTSLGRGIGHTERSTLLLRSSVAGRLEDGELRDTVLDASARYYIKQSSHRLFFTTLEASTGRKLDLDDQLLLGGDNGLRGYPLRYQGGTSRALFTAEQRYFTDWYPFRLFRVGAAAFVDIGRTWGDTPVSTRSLGLLKDIGIGLRIGNSRSGLGNIVHVDLAIPLDGDSSIKNVQFLVETKERF